jgi:hypothetical protein
MALPCDVCDVYHSLGWDTCPACHPAPCTEPTPVDPGMILSDLAEQITLLRYAGERPDAATLAVWDVLVHEAMRALWEQTRAHLHALAEAYRADAPPSAPTPAPVDEDEDVWDSEY